MPTHPATWQPVCSPARSFASADSASCALNSETALPSVTYRASQRSAASSNLVGSCSAQRNKSLSGFLQREVPDLPRGGFRDDEVATLDPALRTEGLYVSGQDSVYGVGLKPDHRAAL
jgi:hypothetical protein